MRRDLNSSSRVAAWRRLFGLGALLAGFWLGTQTLPVRAQSASGDSRDRGGAQVRWERSYEAARREVLRTGRPLFIDFYTDWCGSCKQLDRTTFRDARFVAESRHWVMLKLNPESGASPQAIAERFEVSGFPTLLLLDRRERAHKRFLGPVSANELVPRMTRLRQMLLRQTSRPVRS